MSIKIDFFIPSSDKSSRIHGVHWIADGETKAVLLPVLFLSGDRDPVGQNGQGVRRAYRVLEKTGLRDISIKLYPGARHELLNETNRGQVFRDLRTWMETRMFF